MKFIKYYLGLSILLGCGIVKERNTHSILPQSVTEFKSYVDSILLLKTDKKFIIGKNGLKVFNMLDTTEKIDVCVDTMCFDLYKEYKYLIKQHDKDELIQYLVDRLKAKSEIKQEYYLLLAEKKYSCYFNEVSQEMICPEFISNFTFYDKNLLPLAKYYWWRGSLRSKDMYIYQNSKITDTLRVNL